MTIEDLKNCLEQARCSPKGAGDKPGFRGASYARRTWAKAEISSAAQ